MHLGTPELDTDISILDPTLCDSRLVLKGICFLGKLKFEDFIGHHLGENPGQAWKSCPDCPHFVQTFSQQLDVGQHGEAMSFSLVLLCGTASEKGAWTQPFDLVAGDQLQFAEG